MQSYNMENNQDNVQDQNEEYKQDLGLRKMLYKYQHQNQQLKNQIKALTERLETIMASKTETQPQSQQQAPTSAHEKFWNDQLSYYYKRIQQLNSEIKASKQLIDEAKEQQFIAKSNLLKDKDKKLQQLRSKAEKLSKEQNQDQTASKAVVIRAEKGSTVVNEEEYENKLLEELDGVRKRIRQLEKTRNNNQKNDIHRHRQIVELGEKTRKINHQGTSPPPQPQVEERSRSPKKGGLWGMQFTDENYYNVKEELTQLKKEKNSLLQSIKIQNNNLRRRVESLKNQYVDISTASINNMSSLHLQNATNPKRSKEIAYLSTPKKYPELSMNNSVVLPEIPLGNSAYERKNDKNYVQKAIRMVQWSGTAKNKIKRISSGLTWNDENRKSPITGINLWMDKYLIGIQFIHTLGQSVQHLHFEGGQGKKLIPIQYRLSGNDYLENIILVINNGTNSKPEVPINAITGIQLASKSGRKDSFGQKTGSQGTQKFNFNIRAPQKPIYSTGTFTIDPTSHMSRISKLGFAVI